MATQLSSVSSTLLPPTITGPIFAKVAEQSAIQNLARRVPLSLTAGTAVPVPMDLPVADWVAEGGVKPGSQVGVGMKMMTGKKLAVLVPVSEEVARTNPAGVYDQLQQDLPTALARAFDYTCVTGKSLRSGNAGPFSDYLAMSPNTVTLGTTAANAGGLYVDLANGIGNVIDRNYDFTGFAADKRLIVEAMKAVDANGRPLFKGVDAAPSLSLAVGSGQGSLAEMPAFFSQGVSGKYWRQGDSTQTLTINGTPTGGTFTLTNVATNQSYQAAYNVTAATLQTQIQSWGGVFSSVTVSGTGPYTITFPAIGSNVANTGAPFYVSATNLTGGTNPSVTIVSTGQGATDTNIRAIGGDWSQAAYGVGMDITIRISNEASYYDGTNWHSAYQENLVLLLAEAYYGFVIGNPLAFNVYTKGSLTP